MEPKWAKRQTCIEPQEKDWQLKIPIWNSYLVLTCLDRHKKLEVPPLIGNFGFSKWAALNLGEIHLQPGTHGTVKEIF